MSDGNRCGLLLRLMQSMTFVKPFPGVHYVTIVSVTDVPIALAIVALLSCLSLNVLLALLREAEATGAWQKATDAARDTAAAIQDAADAAGVPVVTDAVGAMFGFFLADVLPTTYDEVQRSDKAAFARLHGLLLERGVYLPPSPFEACFTSSAHTPEVVGEAAEAFRGAFAAL